MWSPNLFSFHFHSKESSTSLYNTQGFPDHIKKKKSWERLKVTLSPVHESSIILLPSMSRSWLFILTLAASNLYSGLILAFQRHWIWPYHPVRVVLVVSPRAVIECGCRRTVDGVQLIRWSLRWSICSTVHYLSSDWVTLSFSGVHEPSYGAQTIMQRRLFFFRKELNDNNV